MEKKNKIIIAIVLIVAAVVLSVVSYILLPDRVVIQFSLGGSGNTYAPKWTAVLLPLALTAGGAVASVFVSDGRERIRSYVVSAVGILVFGLTLAFNLLTAVG